MATTSQQRRSSFMMLLLTVAQLKDADSLCHR